MTKILESAKERAHRLGVPYVEPLKQAPQYDPNPVVAVCGACLRDVHRIEGYSCPRTDCPIRLSDATSLLFNKREIP